MAETYRLLCDEHIEPEVVERLEDAGHDVIHIDTMSDLDNGASDLDLAAYSRGN
jgi:predicted nuclease of predicted toxin-antitoxin system